MRQNDDRYRAQRTISRPHLVGAREPDVLLLGNPCLQPSVLLTALHLYGVDCGTVMRILERAAVLNQLRTRDKIFWIRLEASMQGFHIGRVGFLAFRIDLPGTLAEVLV